MTRMTQAVRRATIEGLDSAVHRSRALSRAGALERMFTLAFRGLVYPQIWEDPAIDMEALALRPGDHVAAIASGGCNVLSYLTAGPAKISAIDLNGAHVALGRLKLCAAKTLPDHASFLRFFGEANSQENVAAYDRHIRPALDAVSAAYWNARRAWGRRRICVFAHGFYRYGLLGKFIGGGHLLGKLYGCEPEAVLRAKTLAEQREAFERCVAPIFDKGFAKWLSRQPASLFGLGIPPAQYRKLAADRPGGIGAVLRHRLERLACDFPVSENYFAWQGFGRRYATKSDEALPPYLQSRHFEAVRKRADRVDYHQQSMTGFLATQPAASVDAFVLLDAQDWMGDDDLAALWTEIGRTAAPAARVIFRTAADERLLPGRVPQRLLAPWTTDEAECRAWCDRDRSSIYGGFHLYRRAA